MIGCEHHVVAFFSAMTFPCLVDTYGIKRKNETQRDASNQLKQRVAYEISHGTYMSQVDNWHYPVADTLL